jgi:hypothetical protein
MSPVALFSAMHEAHAICSWHGGRWEPTGSRPSLRPLSFSEGETIKQSSGEMRREDAKACLRAKMRVESAGRSPHTPSLRGARDKIAEQVCADATKQSRVFPRWDSGLLRCARNDGVETAMHASSALVPRTQRSALFGGGLQSRGPSISACAASRVPALRRNANGVAARPGHARVAFAPPS